MTDISPAYALARFVIEFVSVVKSGDIEWQKEKLDEIGEIKRKNELKRQKLNTSSTCYRSNLQTQ